MVNVMNCQKTDVVTIAKNRLFAISNDCILSLADELRPRTISSAELQPICFLFGACCQLACGRIPGAKAAATIITTFLYKQS